MADTEWKRGYVEKLALLASKKEQLLKEIRPLREKVNYCQTRLFRQKFTVLRCLELNKEVVIKEIAVDAEDARLQKTLVDNLFATATQDDAQLDVKVIHQNYLSLTITTRHQQRLQLLIELKPHCVYEPSLLCMDKKTRAQEAQLLDKLDQIEKEIQATEVVLWSSSLLNPLFHLFSSSFYCTLEGLLLHAFFAFHHFSIYLVFLFFYIYLSLK